MIPIINSLAEELNIDKICGKLLQPLTELEKVLDDVPESERIKYVSNLIVAALDSSNPVELIQFNLDFKRSVMGKQKIVSYIAQSKNMNNIQAERYLKEMIRSSGYFKNYAKLDHTRL